MKEKKIRFRHIEEMKDFVSAACRCEFDIDIISDRLVVDGKSILGVLSLNCTEKSPMAERRQTEIEGRWLLRGAPKHRSCAKAATGSACYSGKVYRQMYLMRSVL